MSQTQTETSDKAPTLWRQAGLFMVRYGIGGAMVLAGIVVLVVSPGGLGPHGFAMVAAAGGSVLLLNLLVRMSITGERDREREEEARRYFDDHGEWPEDEDERPSGRRWVLPAGVMTAEEEERRRINEPANRPLAAAQ